MRQSAKRLPFVFAGVNVNPAIYEPITSLDSPGGPIYRRTGTYSALRGVLFGYENFTECYKIVILTDASPSSDLVLSNFKERYLDQVTDSPLQVIGYMQVETFAEWKEKVTEYQTEADFLVS